MERDLKPIRAVLFDSGEVLMRPISPAAAPREQPWRKYFPGPNFESIVRSEYPDVELDGLDDGILQGMEELDRLHSQPIWTPDEEVGHFSEFYRILLNACGVSDPGLAYELAHDRVFQPDIEPYPETPEVLKRIHGSGLVLGVLSEAWPSLELNYQRIGIRDYFRAFVISANHGILKDDPRLFAVAEERLGIPAKFTLFLDDWAPYVQVAIDSGFQGAVVARHASASRVEGLTYLVNLNEVEDLLLSRADGHPG